MDTTITKQPIAFLELPRFDIDFFVPEVSEYYRRKEEISAEVALETKPLSFEEEILRYATVRLW